MKRLALLLLCVGALMGQNDWTRVEALPPGSLLSVWGKSEQRKGRFLRATADAIVLSRGSKELSIARKDITRVARRTAKARLKNGRNGALIGFASGFASGFILPDTEKPKANFILGAFGSAFGFLIGLAGPGYETAYRNP